MPNDRDLLVIVPTAAVPPDIGRFLWMLEDVRAITKRCVDGISQTVLDWSPAPAANSIGTLLYHIGLVEAGWLYFEALAQPVPDDIAALLPHDSRDASSHLTVVTGVSIAEHLARLDTIRAHFLAAYGGLSPDAFRHVRNLPEYDVTPEWIAYHLIEHEAGHRGELATTRTLAEIATGEA
ncbi:MAG TPA: DinB family protein [Gemmatimonadaceae bacterium]